jgi:head-tail adaptor
VFNEPVSIVNPTTETDGYGDEVFVYDDEDAVAEWCAFEPAGTTETLDGRTAVTQTPRLYLQTGSAITAHARVTVRGDEFEVDGEPARWIDPFSGGSIGVVASLKRVAG